MELEENSKIEANLVANSMCVRGRACMRFFVFVCGGSFCLIVLASHSFFYTIIIKNRKWFN